MGERLVDSELVLGLGQCVLCGCPNQRRSLALSGTGILKDMKYRLPHNQKKKIYEIRNRVAPSRRDTLKPFQRETIPQAVFSWL